MPAPKNSIPMLCGQGPFDYITMGGMFTVLKVREGLTTFEDPGWYQHPAGTVAHIASHEDLNRDRIQLPPTAAVDARLKAEVWCGKPPLKSPVAVRERS